MLPHVQHGFLQAPIFIEGVWNDLEFPSRIYVSGTVHGGDVGTWGRVWAQAGVWAETESKVRMGVVGATTGVLCVGVSLPRAEVAYEVYTAGVI